MKKLYGGGGGGNRNKIHWDFIRRGILGKAARIVVTYDQKTRSGGGLEVDGGGKVQVRINCPIPYRVGRLRRDLVAILV